MFSKTHYFKTFLIMLAFSAISANANAAAPFAIKPNTNSTDNMLLPPPAYLHIGARGTSWVNLDWPLVAGAAQYRLITLEVATNTIVSNMLVPGYSNTATVSGLAQNVVYQSIIFSVESNGTESVTGTFSDDYQVIILEIGTKGGFTNAPQGTDRVCPLGSCGFTWSSGGQSAITYFSIEEKGTGITRFFTLQNTDQNHVLVTKSNNCNTPFDFFTENGSSPGKFMLIKYNGNQIARLTCQSPATPNGEGTIYRDGLQGDPQYHPENYNIYRWGPAAFGDPSNDTRDEGVAVAALDQKITASPNPFSNLLEINIPFTTEETDVRMSLFDAQGRLMISQRVPGGQQIQTLSTENLDAGIYLLRVQSGDRVESLRVVKTQ